MAKSTTIRIEGEGSVVADAADEEQKNLDELNKDQRDEVFRVTDEIRATVGARLMIVRTYPSTPDLAGHVGDMNLDEYSPERVRELFGPGRYRIRVVGPKGFLPGGGPLHIAKTNQAPPGSNGAATDLAGLMALLQKQQDEARSKTSDRIGKLTELAIPGLLSIIAAFVGKNHSQDLTPIIAALKPPPQPSMLEIATMLKTLQGTPDSGHQANQIETLFKIVEVVKDVTGGSEKEDNIWSVVREALKTAIPALQPMLENLQAQSQAKIAAQQQTPLPRIGAPGSPIGPRVISPSAGTASSTMSAPSSAPSAAPRDPAATVVSVAPAGTPSTSGDDMLAVWAMNNGSLIRATCDKITQWATEHKRPDLYAEVFLDELPQDLAPHLPPQRALDILQNPDWWSFVTQFHPAIKPHFVWLDQFRVALIEVVQDQLEQLESINAQPVPVEHASVQTSDTAATQSAPPQIVDVYTGDVGV